MARHMAARMLCAALLAALYLLHGAAARAQALVPDASNHRIEVGDLLQVTIFDGISPTSFGVQVDKTGSIRLPLVEQVNVTGKLTYEVSDQLTSLYKTYYVQPVVSVAIVQYGSFQVYVFGSDVPSQLVMLPSGSRFFDLLQQMGKEGSNTAKALMNTGRSRQVHIIRGGFSLTALLSQQLPKHNGTSSPAPNLLQTQAPSAISNSRSLVAYTNWRPWIEERERDPNSRVWVIDPLQISLEGELSKYNVQLEDGDVIFIPTPERFVDIEGVALAGRYELLGDETLGDIMRMSGSPNYEADLENAVIRRYDTQGVLSRLYINFYPALDSLEAARSFKLQNRDRISFFPRENRVFVLGAVQTAGAFTYQSDSTVLDYIAQAEGETDQANLAWIAIIRQNRNRLAPYTAAEVTQVNFKQIHKGLPLCSDVSVQPGDVIYVPPKGYEFSVAQVLQTVGTLVTGYDVFFNNGKNNSTTVAPSNGTSTK